MKTYSVVSVGDFMNKKSEISRKKVTTEMTADNMQEIENNWIALSKAIRSDLANQNRFVLGDLELQKIILK